MSGSQQQQEAVIYYSLCNLNLHLILSLVMEHSPGWIIDGSRKQWILYAIKTKDLTFLRILSQTIVPFINTSEYLEFAAGIEDNIPIMEYLLSLNCPVDQLKVLISAVEKKALKNLKFLHEKMEFCIDDNYRVFDAAAGIKDNISILEYLKSHNCPTGYSKWFLNNGFSMENYSISRAARRNGSLKYPLSLEKCSFETLEWLVRINRTEVFREAARNGCLDLVKLMLKKNYSIEDSGIFVAAAEHGSLENLEWLLKNGCPINSPYIFVEAARKGHFEAMKWLLKNKCPINCSFILAAAAEFGSIEQIEWLLDNKCPIDCHSMFETAAAMGNVELMEWLIEKGYPTDYAMYGAVQHGCLVIMKWLVKKGCPIVFRDLLMILAAEYGSLRNMKWLFENRCPINNSEIFEAAASQGSLDIMKWLLDNGCPIDHPDIMKKAAEYGSLVNMKWLLANGCPVNDRRIFYLALSHGSLRNLKWLLENKCPVDEFSKSKAEDIFGSFEKLLELLGVDPSIVIYQ